MVQEWGGRGEKERSEKGRRGVRGEENWMM